MPATNAIPAAQLREPSPSPRVDAMPAMVVDPAEYERRTNAVRQFVREQMTPSIDFGDIPGAGKPALFKPGAEKLLAIFGFASRYEVTHRIETLCDKTPFCLYEVKVFVECKRSRQLIAEGLGSCNSKERKYKNQDAANIANTVLKMAKKRALIDATLLATRTSNLFSSGDTKETNNSAPAVEPEAQPQLTLVASREQLQWAEQVRQRAVALGYRTSRGDKPKPIAEGESKEAVRAKTNRWREFIKSKTETPASPTTDTPEAAPPKEGKGPRYTIPTYARPDNCTSCGGRIFWTLTKEKKKVPVDPTGYSHFTTCPNASQHSQKNGQPGWLKHLFAVAGANGLDVTDKTRTERMAKSNAVLLDHGFEAVKSWNELGKERAQCLAGAIDAGILTWGTPAQVGEAA